MVNSIQITWNDGGTTETGYRLYRGLPSTGVLLITTGPLNGNTHSYLDTQVTCGSGQLYSVEAFNLDPVCPTSVPATQTGFCAQYQSWYQVQGGGVIAAAGPVSVNLPPASPQPYFILDAPGGIPGMVGSNGQGGNLSSANANSQNWIFDLTDWTSLLARPNNNFFGIRDKLMARIQSPVEISGTVNSSQLISAIDSAPLSAKTPIDEIVVLNSSNLTIQDIGTINLGTRKALLISNGNVSLNSSLLINPGGFWGIISSGNISIDPQIGEPTPHTDIASASYSPHLIGIYYAQGIFNTGTSNPPEGTFDRQLRIDGTVIGIGGVTLSRKIEGPFPAEFFSFRPDLTIMLHRIGLRTNLIHELLVP